MKLKFRNALIAFGVIFGIPMLVVGLCHTLGAPLEKQIIQPLIAIFTVLGIVVSGIIMVEDNS